MRSKIADSAWSISAVLIIVFLAIFAVYCQDGKHQLAYVFPSDGHLIELEIQQKSSVRWKQRRLSDGAIVQEGKDTKVIYLGVSNRHLVLQHKNDVVVRPLTAPQQRIAMRVGQLEPALSKGFKVTTVTSSYVTLRTDSGARFNVFAGDRLEPAKTPDGNFRPELAGEIRSAPWTGTPLKMSLNQPRVIFSSLDGATVGVEEKPVVMGFDPDAPTSDFPHQMVGLLNADGSSLWLKNSDELSGSMGIKHEPHATLFLRAAFAEKQAVHLVLEHTQYRRVDQTWHASKNLVFYVALGPQTGAVLHSFLIHDQVRPKKRAR